MEACYSRSAAANGSTLTIAGSTKVLMRKSGYEKRNRNVLRRCLNTDWRATVQMRRQVANCIQENDVILFTISRQYCMSERLQEWRRNNTASPTGKSGRPLRPKLHYTDTGYGHVVQHHQRTPPTNELTTLFYNKFATLQCQSPTSRHVKMLGCNKFLSVCEEFVVQQVVELL